ncbi:MAG: 3'-5' exonuclease, partial [Gammaproteobacteria bacterium]|nr:3'-5' exonuclease [Gammaproteobacteria bacterium]
DLQNWPRVVQIAWTLCDDAGNEVAWAEHIIRPDGFVIPPEAARVHGISTERAHAEGLPLEAVLDLVSEALANAGVLIAHNIAFDEKVLGAEFLRRPARPLPLDLPSAWRGDVPQPVETAPAQRRLRRSRAVVHARRLQSRRPTIAMMK